MNLFSSAQFTLIANAYDAGQIAGVAVMVLLAGSLIWKFVKKK